MDLGLNGRTALVLGASSGLGRATALEFAREGAAVTIFGRSEAGLADVAQQILDLSGRPATVVVGDVTRPADIARLVAAAAARTGVIDACFVNGGGPRPGAFADLDDEAWQAAFEGTLLAYVRVIRAIVPHLPSDGGWILCNTSSGVKAVLNDLILSNVFRSGVVALVKTLAVELGPSNVRVNAIAAGRIGTGRVEQLDQRRAERAGVSPAEIRATAEASIPLGRYGDPAEFARVAVFHCSPANTYLTGQTLLVDGGLVRAF